MEQSSSGSKNIQKVSQPDGNMVSSLQVPRGYLDRRTAEVSSFIEPLARRTELSTVGKEVSQLGKHDDQEGPRSDGDNSHSLNISRDTVVERKEEDGRNLESMSVTNPDNDELQHSASNKRTPCIQASVERRSDLRNNLGRDTRQSNTNGQEFRHPDGNIKFILQRPERISGPTGASCLEYCTPRGSEIQPDGNLTTSLRGPCDTLENSAGPAVLSSNRIGNSQYPEFPQPDGNIVSSLLVTSEGMARKITGKDVNQDNNAHTASVIQKISAMESSG